MGTQMANGHEIVIRALGDMLQEKLDYRPGDDDVFELESQTLIDVILSVEAQTGLIFNGENAEFDQLKIKLLAQLYS